MAWYLNVDPDIIHTGKLVKIKHFLKITFLKC